MSGYGETRLAEPEHWEICESWLTSAEKIVTLKWWKMTALSECAVEKEGLHGLASRIKLIDSDCWMDRRAARENRTMLLCKGWTHDATGANLSQRKRRENQSTKCVCMLLQPGICITGTLGSTLDSTAASIVVDILTNTETALATPPTVMLIWGGRVNSQKMHL